MIVAYLVNQYPRVSHSFIRREILALEALGVIVQRYSLRSCIDELVDPRDIEEARKTTVILEQKWPMARRAAFLALQRPRRFLRSLIEAARLNARSRRGAVAHIAYFAEACYLCVELEKRKVQHLHAHFGTNPAAVALLCRLLGGPEYSFTVHGPEEFDEAPLLALDRKAREAKFVVAISEYCKSQLIRLLAANDQSKLRVVRCGLDGEMFDVPIEPVPDTARIVCVGRLSQEKGHMGLLQAVANLSKRGIEIRVFLVGDGGIRSQLESRIRELGLDAAVTLTGYATQERVIAELLAARALVLPSLAEGLPVVIMEAMALGRPVLSTFIAGIPELVIPGKTGWLIPAGSIDSLTATLHEVMCCPLETLQRMADNGREVVKEHHDVRVSARLLREYFETP